jgi:hypothetical protein
VSLSPIRPTLDGAVFVRQQEGQADATSTSAVKGSKLRPPQGGWVRRGNCLLPTPTCSTASFSTPSGLISSRCCRMCLASTTVMIASSRVRRRTLGHTQAC